MTTEQATLIAMKYCVGDLEHYPDSHFDVLKLKGVERLPVPAPYFATAHYIWINELDIEESAQRVHRAIVKLCIGLDGLNMLAPENTRLTDGDTAIRMIKAVSTLLDLKSQGELGYS